MFEIGAADYRPMRAHLRAAHTDVDDGRETGGDGAADEPPAPTAFIGPSLAD